MHVCTAELRSPMRRSTVPSCGTGIGALNSSTFISIAMASYNGGRFIGRQLQSFANQSLLPSQLVICDDGSSDDTVAIVEEFAARAPFDVQLVINPERLGYNRNFAKAIGLCTGDLIFLSDQDDEWYEDKIATLSALFEAQPSHLAIVNDQDIVRAQGEASGTTVLGNVRRLGYSDLVYGPGCCTAIRKTLLSIAAPFPGDAVAYDYWINMLPAVLGVRRLHEQPLQSYRRHGNNTSGAVFSLERPTIRHLAAPTDKAATRAAYAVKIRGIDLILERLAARRAELDALGLSARYEPARAALMQERYGYSVRLECLARGRIMRVPLILKTLLTGGYKQFQGYKSALKDLVA
jgi:glycosyltransferase involved in cell wall biosynthesis